MQEAISIPRKVDDSSLVIDLDFDLSDLEVDIASCRQRHADFDSRLIDLYRRGASIDILLNLRTNFIDKLLIRIYESYGLKEYENLALVAVGGYGRKELFLRSDIDFLILSQSQVSDPECNRILESFISFLWDIKLHIGSSVRDIAQCIRESHHDITIKTNLLETRLITGSRENYNLLIESLNADPYWSRKLFFDAKIDEQIQRHHDYTDHAYTLEPDIKNNQGGIRDLQTIMWVSNFCLGAKTFFDMYRINLIEKDEFEELINARNCLAEIRYALHTVVDRIDNRLILDRQKQVAAILGFGEEGNMPVEKMMRVFFRTVKQVKELNMMTLQLVLFNIRGYYDNYAPVFINNYFIKRGRLLDVIDPDIFMQEYHMILEVFYVFSKHRDVMGLHVNCIRALRETRNELNFYLIQDPKCRQTFKKILSDQGCLERTLSLMNDCRVLSSYMPQWEHIEGQTQFDMFHVFSVDEHTIKALMNIQIYSKSKEDQYSLFKNIYHQLAEPQILFAAAFLHDIAKGRGGNHSELGAKDALYFCQLHGYTQHQIKLVSWLVQNHLLMSITTKRYDITDFEVINDFAVKVEDEEHLNLLYCLSVIDIAATNEREWTSWKDSIFKQLFFLTRDALRHGLSVSGDIKAHALENQQLAMRHMGSVAEEKINALWQNFQMNYFCQYTPFDIAWHTRNILTQNFTNKPLVLFAQNQQDVTEMMVYSDKEPLFFANIACVMAEKRMSVQSAQIVRTNDNHSLATIQFQNQMDTQLDNERLPGLRKSIISSFSSNPTLPKLNESEENVFNIKPNVQFFDDHSMRHTNIEISALDRTGLLAKIGVTLNSLECLILSARVTTTGARAEDFFAVTDIEGRPLSDEKQDELKSALIENINKTL